MKSNRFANIKKLCAKEMFDNLLKTATEKDMTSEEAEVLYKSLMGEKDPEEIEEISSKPVIPHKVVEKGQIQLPFEPEVSKYTPGVISVKKCPVCGFLNSPVWIMECKYCESLYEKMKNLVENRGFSINEAVAEAYMPFKNIEPGAKIPGFDRLSSRTRIFVSPNVLRHIYTTEGKTPLSRKDIVEIESPSNYMRLQNLLNERWNIQTDFKSGEPIYDEYGHPIPLEKNERKFLSLNELAKRLLMSKEAVLDQIGEYNSEHGLVPEKHYVPGKEKEPGYKWKYFKPESGMGKGPAKKGTGIGPAYYYNRDYQIFEWASVRPAFIERIKEVSAIFKQLIHDKFNRQVAQTLEKVEQNKKLLESLKAKLQTIENYKEERYSRLVRKKLMELDDLKKLQRKGISIGKQEERILYLENRLGRLYDEHKKKEEKIRHRVAITKKQITQNIADVAFYKEQLIKHREKMRIEPKPWEIDLDDLQNMQKDEDLEEVYEEHVPQKEKISRQERINIILKIAAEELFLPGLEPEEEEKEEEKEVEKTPEGLSGLKFFQPEIKETEKKESPPAPPPPKQTLEEMEAELKQIGEKEIDESFGDKKGIYKIQFIFKPKDKEPKKLKSRFKYTPGYRNINFEVLLQEKISKIFGKKLMEKGALPGTYVKMMVEEPITNQDRIYSFLISEEGEFNWLSTTKEEYNEKIRLLNLPENEMLHIAWKYGKINMDELAIVGGKLIEKPPEKKSHRYKWLENKIEVKKEEARREEARKKMKDQRRKQKEKIEKQKIKHEKELTALPPELREELEEERELAGMEYEPKIPEYKEPEEKEKEMVKIKCPHCKRDNWVEKGKEDIETCQVCNFPVGNLTFVVRYRISKIEEVEEKIPIPEHQQEEGGARYKTITVEKKSFFYKYSMVSFQRDAQGSLSSAKCWEVPAKTDRLSRTTHTFEIKSFPNLWEQTKSEKDWKIRKKNYKNLVEQKHPGEPAYKTITQRAPMVGPPGKLCKDCPGEVKPPFSKSNCREIKSAYKYMLGEKLPYIIKVWPAGPLMDIERVIERKYSSRFNKIYQLYKTCQKEMTFTPEEAGIKPKEIPKEFGKMIKPTKKLITAPEWFGKVKKDVMKKSKSYYLKGRMKFNVGEFLSAIADYSKGYKLVPMPGFLFNIGQSYRSLAYEKESLFDYRGAYAAYHKAIDFYTQYLAENPRAPKGAISKLMIEINNKMNQLRRKIKA